MLEELVVGVTARSMHGTTSELASKGSTRVDEGVERRRVKIV